MAVPPNVELLLLEPVQKLSGVVDSVLIGIGKVFRDSQQGDRTVLSYAREKLQQELPIRQNELHAALDDIEVEVLEAKAILEHKLSALRAAQEIQNEAAPDPMSGQQGLAVDDIHADLPQQTEAIDAILPEKVTETNGLVANEPAVVQVDSQLSASSALGGLEKLAQADGILDLTTANPDVGLNESTQAIDDSGGADIDFQSMFPSETSKDMIFDLDFSANATETAADLLPNDTFDFATEAIEPDDATTAANGAVNAEITSLLPDLDSFVQVDAGDGNTPSNDLAAFDAAKATGGDLSMLTASAAVDPAAAGNNVPPETTFGDLFGETNLTVDGDMAGEMEEVGAFDDDWFKSL